MKYNLPPLKALRTFESAARNLSFTKAANELFVTQGAISKQIRNLEDYLGFTLFKRVHQGLVLTDKALRYYEDIHIIFNKINEVTQSIKHDDQQSLVLNLNVLPSFSSLLIAPNIDSFKRDCGDIKLTIKASDDDINLIKQDDDIFIRCARQEFAGLQNIHLIKEKMLMVASAQIAKQINNIKDISKYVIIEHGSRPHILEKMMKKTDLDFQSLNKISFEHFFMIIEAVRNNVGIGFVPSFLVKKLINDKELVNLLNINYVTGYNYYLLCKDDGDNNKIRIFRDWLENLITNYDE